MSSLYEPQQVRWPSSKEYKKQYRKENYERFKHADRASVQLRNNGLYCSTCGVKFARLRMAKEHASILNHHIAK